MKKVKLFVGLVVVLVVFIVAELIYIIHNRPELLLKYYINSKSKQLNSLSKQPSIEELIIDLDDLVETKIILTKNRFKGDDWVNRVEFGGLIEDEFLKGKYYEILSKPSGLWEFLGKGGNLAGLYYQLGLLAYENQAKDLVEYFWSTAVRLEPEWGFFHLELANFYLSEDKRELAQKSLWFCLKFKYPKNSCQNYLDKMKVNSVGYWKDSVEEYFPLN